MRVNFFCFIGKRCFGIFEGMKYVILFLLFSYSFFGQSNFSKDILVNKTIFKFLAIIKNDISLEKIDTIFFEDNALKRDQILKQSSLFVGEFDIHNLQEINKDTIFNNTALRGTTKNIYWEMTRSKKKFAYALKYTICSVRENEISISYELYKVIRYRRYSYKQELIGKTIWYKFKSDKSLSNELKEE
jgi:hypothetical protein